MYLMEQCWSVSSGTVHLWNNEICLINFFLLSIDHRTMGKNSLIVGPQNLAFPWAWECASERTSERSGAREQSKQCGASKRVSCASERANGQVSGQVLTFQFLAFLTYRASIEKLMIFFWRGIFRFTVIAWYCLHISLLQWIIFFRIRFLLFSDF